MDEPLHVRVVVQLIHGHLVPFAELEISRSLHHSKYSDEWSNTLLTFWPLPYDMPLAMVLNRPRRSRLLLNRSFRLARCKATTMPLVVVSHVVSLTERPERAAKIQLSLEVSTIGVLVFVSTSKRK